MNSVTEQIDTILRNRGMSRRQLAVAANIPASSLQAAMARGRNMTVEMLQSIAAVLNMPVSSFFSQEQYESEFVDNELSSFIEKSLDKLRGAAESVGVSIGEFLGASPEKVQQLNNLESERSSIQERIEWLEHDPFITEDRIENLKYECSSLEKEQMSIILNVILERGQVLFSSSEQEEKQTKAKSTIDELNSLFQQLNDRGQKKLSAYMEELFRLLVQIPAYQKSVAPDMDAGSSQKKAVESRDVFGSTELPFK